MARYDVVRHAERRAGRGRPRDDDDNDNGRGAWFGDPEHDRADSYRGRRHRDHDERVDPTIDDQPFAGRAYPDPYGPRGVPDERPLGRQQWREEHSWRRPSSWYGGWGTPAAGAYRGVGPKGYTRSDERIREHVCDVLMDDSHLDAADIEVEVKDGEVTLNGTVDSRDAKRHAEGLAEQATGVKDVHNRLRIAPRS
jgi:hypothetical protein